MLEFVETEKTMEDFLLGTHTDYLNPWITVHDEVDFVVPKALSAPIMKTVSIIASLKELIDKYKLPGLSMSYDIEFDRWNSWTASSDVDIYAYPLNHKEAEIYEELKRVESILSSTKYGKVYTIEAKVATPEFLAKVQSLPDGLDEIYIVNGDSKFKYERTVDYSKLG